MGLGLCNLCESCPFRGLETVWCSHAVARGVPPQCQSALGTVGGPVSVCWAFVRFYSTEMYIGIHRDDPESDSEGGRQWLGLIG